MTAKLIWATPEIDSTIAYLARVSNPNAAPDDPAEKLINYLIDHKHWSPLEMACVCLEVHTTRDIGRQLLRHYSFNFQEFSQRYAEVDTEEAVMSTARLQDYKNRQNSLSTTDPNVINGFYAAQTKVWDTAVEGYQKALKLGVAKELARKLLPEGLTKSKMYVQGSVRSWYHYLDVRLGPETQLEHQLLARECLLLLKTLSPAIFGRFR